MLGMFAAGGLAVTLYRRRAHYQAVTLWMGARLGAMTGAWGMGLIVVLSAIELLGSSSLDAVRKALYEQMQQALTANPDPRTLEQMHAYFDQMRSLMATDSGLLAVLAVWTLLAVGLLAAFSALGGMLGAALFGRDSGRKEP